MAKETINAKEILVDIKAGMDNAALMEKYQLSEKGLQNLFKKLEDAGVLKQREPEKRPSGPHKVIQYTWKCPACGKPQTRRSDECPECGRIGSRIKTELSEQVEEIKDAGTRGEYYVSGGNGLQEAQERIHETSSGALDKVKTMLRKPYVAAIAGAAIMLVVVVVFFGVHRRGGEPVQSKVATSNPSKVETPDTEITESAKNTKGGLPEEIEEQIVEHYSSLPAQPFFPSSDPHEPEDLSGISIGLIRPTKVRIIKAEGGVPTKEIVAKMNPKKIWCIKLAIEAEWGQKHFSWSDSPPNVNPFVYFAREAERAMGLAKAGMLSEAIEHLGLSDLKTLDKSSACFLNIIVWVSQSGKITSSGIDGQALGSGVSCPQDWDNVCPFGCGK